MTKGGSKVKGGKRGKDGRFWKRNSIGNWEEVEQEEAEWREDIGKDDAAALGLGSGLEDNEDTGLDCINMFRAFAEADSDSDADEVSIAQPPARRRPPLH